MGKLQLKSYMHQLSKEELIEQVIDLYETSKEVKKYYDFLLNPNLTKIADEWKVKISKEYFPTYGRRVRARRGVGQKAVRELEFLGVTPDIIADVRMYAIEVAVLYTIEMQRADVAFNTSIEKQYIKLIDYVKEHGLLLDFKVRCCDLKNRVISADWVNAEKIEEKYLSVYLKSV